MAYLWPPHRPSSFVTPTGKTRVGLSPTLQLAAEREQRVQRALWRHVARRGRRV